MNKVMQLLIGSLVVLVLSVGTALADYTLNMPVGVTKISREVYDLHMFVIWICVGISVLVYGVMFYAMINHRKSKGAVAAKFHESLTVEILWTIIPFIILIVLAVPATTTLIDMYDTSEADMTIKVTGYQWKWRYEYLDENINFMSSLDAKSNEARQVGSNIDPATIPNYLLEVDHPLVIPINKKIRFLFTAADVIHSWWVPEFGWKKDAIPGFINEAWTNVDTPGTYRGQCAELCGKDHGFMPIVVIAKTQEDYETWVTEQKSLSEAQLGQADKVWTQDDLVVKGEEVYNTSCASCHQTDGAGIPGTFPAITDSPVTTGDLDTHIDVVVNGAGSMMPAFASTLDAVDLAAVITYQRNGLGNDVGDLVQPSDLKSLVQNDDEDDDEEEDEDEEE